MRVGDRIQPGLGCLGFRRRGVEAAILRAQGRTVDAVQHPAGGQIHRRGARNVGTQRVAHRQHAVRRQAEHLQHRLVDRRVGFSQRPHVAAQFLVAHRQGTGTQHADAATDHLQVGVAADHRQAVARAVL